MIVEIIQEVLNICLTVLQEKRKEYEYIYLKHQKMSLFTRKLTLYNTMSGFHKIFDLEN